MRNSGSIGTKIIKLLVNGKQYAYKNCLVGAEQTIKDSIQCRLYPLGKATISITGIIPPQIVSVIDSPVSIGYPFKITRLTMAPMIKINEIQQINYTVQNISGTRRTFHIPLILNDTNIYTDTVTLEPGTKKIMEHSFANPTTGFWQVKVGGMKCDYKVYRNNTESLLLDLSPDGTMVDNIVTDKSGLGNNGHVINLSIDHAQTKDNRLVIGEHCFVEVPNALSLDRMGETITMMAWVYPTGNEKGLVDIFTKGDSHVLQVSDGKTLTFFAGGWGRGDCTVNLPDDWKQHWHHIAGVCTGNTLFLYVDGVLKGTTIMEDAVNLSNSNKWTFGRNEEFPSARIYHGYINHAKVFLEALSQTEIIEIFKKECVDFK